MQCTNDIKIFLISCWSLENAFKNIYAVCIKTEKRNLYIFVICSNVFAVEETLDKFLRISNFEKEKKQISIYIYAFDTNEYKV